MAQVPSIRRKSRMFLLGGSLLLLIPLSIEAGMGFFGVAAAPLSLDNLRDLLLLGAFAVQAALCITAAGILRTHETLAVSLVEASANAETERKKVEAILEAIGDPVSIQDRNFRIIYQNSVLKERGGNLVGQYCYHAYCGKDCVSEARCPVFATFSDGRIHTLEKLVETPRGKKYLEVTASPLADGAGTIIAGIEIIRDVTERKRAEEAVAAQAAFLQRLIDTIPNPIFYKTVDGLYRGCNDAFLRFNGRSRDEVVGKSVFNILPAEMAELVARQDAELFAAPGTQVYQTEICTADEERRHIIFYKATYTDAEGHLEGLVGVMLDVTDRMRAENEVRAMNDTLRSCNLELEAFSHSVSHDLRTPLTAVHIAAQQLQEQWGAATETEEYLLESILAGSRRIEEIIDGVLLLSRMSRAELERQPLDLADLVRETVAELQVSQPQRRVELVVAGPMESVADPKLMRVAIENLVGNAWKYTAERERAVIETGVADASARTFYIRDNGIGFPQEKANELFLPFRRHADSARFPGSGIGLATVRRIVDRHGGTLWAEAIPGRGATFYFTLP